MHNLVGDGNGYVGNLALRANVRAWSRLTSADQQHQLSLKPYLTRVDNYIDAVAANTNWQAGQFNVLQYQNQQSELKGFDLTGETLLAAQHSGQWQLTSNVSYLDTRNTGLCYRESALKS